MSLPDTGTCDGMQLLIQADHDGELDAATTAAMLTHVAGCPSCAALRDRLTALSTLLRGGSFTCEAPAPLRRAILARLPPGRGGVAAWLGAHGVGIAIGAALAACIAVAVVPRVIVAGIDTAAIDGDATDGAAIDEAEIVGSHLRALHSGHLLDVVSTDRHTVKPWFDGRLDYAPPVRDFAPAGFPLKGARLDAIGLRPVAALVYGSDKHLIDVYVLPARGRAEDHGTIRGYNIVRWHADGMQFWAVSDLNAVDLARFRGLWTGH